MAFTKSSTAMLVMVLLAALVMTDVANASSFIAWSGPGCNFRPIQYRNCGCSNINEHGGYTFTYNGQSAAMYNTVNCQGVSHTRFSSSVSSCSAFGWKSMFIQCRK
ncbi:hypothetical protein Syun_019978 [Stephania yunnanensis]|uniref:Antimicrobial peptide 1 n=1 Tax=Stephania yunnanensis TaxID=152371 RepID=A0AAP0IV42_9MAGN